MKVDSGSELLARRQARGSEASWLPAVALALAKLALHLPLGARYGFRGDELYFAECGRRLAWGYVDHGPLVPWVARLASERCGDSLSCLRLPSLDHPGRLGWSRRSTASRRSLWRAPHGKGEFSGLRRLRVGQYRIVYEALRCALAEFTTRRPDQVLARALRRHPAVLVFPGWEIERESAA